MWFKFGTYDEFLVDSDSVSLVERQDTVVFVYCVGNYQARAAYDSLEEAKEAMARLYMILC